MKKVLRGASLLGRGIIYAICASGKLLSSFGPQKINIPNIPQSSSASHHPPCRPGVPFEEIFYRRRAPDKIVFR